jgi:hypothetical protein
MVHLLNVEKGVRRNPGHRSLSVRMTLPTQRTSQTTSGPHVLTDEQRDQHAALKLQLSTTTDVLPIDDPFAFSDDDMIFRHLIAKKFDPNLTLQSLQEYVAFRRDLRVNAIFEETAFSSSKQLLDQTCGYFGSDREGYPVYYDRPNPAELNKLIASEPREVLLRWHVMVAERGRYLAKSSGRDRMTVVMDLQHVGMGIISSPSAMRLLKEFAHIDQHRYPENMRVLCLINAPGTFRFIWKAVKPLLEERVQKKVRVCDRIETLFEVIHPRMIPTEFGGEGKGFTRLGHEFADIQAEMAELQRRRAATPPVPQPQPPQPPPPPKPRSLSSADDATNNDGSTQAPSSSTTDPSTPAAASSAGLQTPPVAAEGAPAASRGLPPFGSACPVLNPLDVGASPPTGSQSTSGSPTYWNSPSFSPLPDHSIPGSPQTIHVSPAGVHGKGFSAGISPRAHDDALVSKDASTEVHPLTNQARAPPTRARRLSQDMYAVSSITNDPGSLHGESFIGASCGDPHSSGQSPAIPLESLETNSPQGYNASRTGVGLIEGIIVSHADDDDPRSPHGVTLRMETMHESSPLGATAHAVDSPTNWSTLEATAPVVALGTRSFQVFMPFTHVPNTLSVAFAPTYTARAEPEFAGEELLPWEFAAAIGTPPPATQLGHVFLCIDLASQQAIAEARSPSLSPRSHHRRRFVDPLSPGRQRRTSFAAPSSRFAWNEAVIMIDSAWETIAIRDWPSKRHVASIALDCVVAAFPIDDPSECDRLHVPTMYATGTEEVALLGIELDPRSLAAEQRQPNPLIVFAMASVATRALWLQRFQEVYQKSTRDRPRADSLPVDMSRVALLPAAFTFDNATL